jgi:hypothetical protein
VDRQIVQAQQEIASLDGERAKALATLNQPQNREVADQSAFLNNLFARKALSWTRVFTEMEKLMPANIHVVSMKPEFNRENQLVLHVVVATTARDKAVELILKNIAAGKPLQGWQVDKAARGTSSARVACARATSGTTRRPPVTPPMNVRRSITESTSTKESQLQRYYASKGGSSQAAE